MIESPARRCAHCSEPMRSGMRSHATFCSPRCAARARSANRPSLFRVCARCGGQFEQPRRAGSPIRYCNGCHRTPADEKQCITCGEVKPSTDFYTSRSRKPPNDGLASSCKTCSRADSLRRAPTRVRNPEYQRNWYRRNREKMRDRDLQRHYGITSLDFDAMLAAQHGQCAICRTTDPGVRGFHVDHDHATGAVRALLCTKCNTGLGLFGDDVARLQSAISYLEEHTP